MALSRLGSKVNRNQFLRGSHYISNGVAENNGLRRITEQKNGIMKTMPYGCLIICLWNFLLIQCDLFRGLMRAFLSLGSTLGQIWEFFQNKCLADHACISGLFGISKCISATHWTRYIPQNPKPAFRLFWINSRNSRKIGKKKWTFWDLNPVCTIQNRTFNHWTRAQFT